MGYKVLGFAVWNGGKWYLRRRYGDKPRKLFAAAVIGVALTGAAVAQRRASVAQQ
jgi:hypothetical protein